MQFLGSNSTVMLSCINNILLMDYLWIDKDISRQKEVSGVSKQYWTRLLPMTALTCLSEIIFLSSTEILGCKEGGLAQNLKYIKTWSIQRMLWWMNLYRCSFYLQISWAGTTMWLCQCQHPPSLLLWGAGRKLNSSPSQLLFRRSFPCHLYKLISGWCSQYCWKMRYMGSILINSMECENES